MASRTSFDKLQRERRKKAKAAAKRARRQGRRDDTTEEATDTDAGLVEDDHGEELGPAELLRRVESLQSRLESGVITLDEFEEEKAELTDRLAKIID